MKMKNSKLMEIVLDALENSEELQELEARIYTYKQQGVLSGNLGLVIKIGRKKEFQLELMGSYGGDDDEDGED